MKKPRRLLRVLLLLLLLLAAGLIGAKWTLAKLAGSPPKEVELLTDLVFGQGGGRDLKLNLTRPQTHSGRMPVPQ